MYKFIRDVGLFILLTLIINWLFALCYENFLLQKPINKIHFKAQQYQAIKNTTKRYDLIFLGSSRGYSSYSPQLFDSILNVQSYNMCSGAQNIIESYYILKEILHYQKPRIVIYEIFPPSFKVKNDYFHILSSASYMGWKGQMDMIIKGFGAEGMLNYIFPALKLKSFVKMDVQNFSVNTTKLSQKSLDQYHYNRGQLIDSSIVDVKTIASFPPIYSFENTRISKTKLNHFFPAFIKLCKDNGITLICVTSAYPPSRMRISPKDTASIYFSNVCKKHNISFIDLNHNNTPSNYYNDTDFADQHHLNYKGADKVSKVLAIQLKKTLQEN